MVRGWAPTWPCHRVTLAATQNSLQSLQLPHLSPLQGCLPVSQQPLSQHLHWHQPHRWATSPPPTGPLAGPTPLAVRRRYILHSTRGRTRTPAWCASAFTSKVGDGAVLGVPCTHAPTRPPASGPARGGFGGSLVHWFTGSAIRDIWSFRARPGAYRGTLMGWR